MNMRSKNRSVYGLWILLLVMLIAFAPAHVHAQAGKYDIWVGGIQVTDENAHDVLGDASVSYHPEDKILRLEDAKIVNDGKMALDTIRRIGKTDLPLVVRVPVIQTVNAEDAQIRAIARFVKEAVRNPRIELLPYHSYGEVKYASLGMRQPDPRFCAPEEMHRLEEIVEAEGVRVEHFA